MNPPDDNLPVLIALAATMRAEGRTWAAIGEEVHRSPDTVRRWPENFPDEWNAPYEAAEARLIAEAAMEARTTLRFMLRSKRGRFRLSAAQSLLRSGDAARARTARAAVDPDTERQAAAFREMRNMSDEELEQNIERYIRAREEEAAKLTAETRALGPAEIPADAG
jgi:hypothetical protein